MSRVRLRVRGTVQGVGFRPFVYRLARRHGLGGWVRNDAGGVVLEAAGETAALDAFRRSLETEAPPLARIAAVEAEDLAPADLPPFFIDASRSGGPRETAVAADAAVCDECLAEMNDPADRRYRYPFLNCTHCGPRFTITHDVPYDRPATGMAGFPLCPDCLREYEDPADRRFHAQPMACPVCGPRLRAAGPDGGELPGDPVRRAGAVLAAGGVVALKGLGGFQLAVSATSEAAVRRLRARKRREAKPLALMARNLEEAARVAVLDAAAIALLTGPEAPVVLLPRRTDSPVAAGVAPGLDEIGVMLPTTPLHHLLLAEEGCALLVMTSGNCAGEPIQVDNDRALDALGGIADLFLLHDRPIVARADDSVVRAEAAETRFIRRSRGYVPRPVPLPAAQPPTLAVGAALKNTLCLTRGSEAFLSQHIGDLDSPGSRDFLARAAAHLERILGTAPEAVAHDLHLDYPSTLFARERSGVRFEPVQHHHAHVAACLAEHGRTGPVVGLALDGFGLGDDGAAWGGEVLVADLAGYRRAGHLRNVPLAGGDRAAREPARMALVHLHQAFGQTLWSLPLPLLERVGPARAAMLLQVAGTGLGSPPTSSAGRLFDAVAALCDLGDHVSYEGEAAMRLEVAARLGADEGPSAAYPLPWIPETAPEPREPALGTGPHFILDTGPLIQAVVADLLAGRSRAGVAASFHAGLAAGLAEAAAHTAHAEGLDTVALSGGCFQNRVLTRDLTARLEARGLHVLVHRRVPAGDGGIALGQAAVAGARFRARGAVTAGAFAGPAAGARA